MRQVLAALVLVLGVAAGLGSAGPAAAQNAFAAAATVNGQAITNFQVDQRSLFLTLLRAPNADRDSARDILIDETLQVQAAQAAGIEVSQDDLLGGLEEFAARGDLSADELVAILEEQGVAFETFRDFIRNGLFWRQLVQQRFAGRVRPSTEEIERTLVRGGGTGGVRVLLSEIVLPVTPGDEGAVRAIAQQLSETIRGEAAFAQAARSNSRAPSAPNGGRIEWRPLAELGPQVTGAILGLTPGQVSEPVDLGNFIAIFLLRDMEEGAAVAPEALSVDYAEYLIPGGRSSGALSAARALRARVDVCDDLYGQAPGQATRLSRVVRPVVELPADLRQELARLDEGEVSTQLVTPGGELRFIMLCARVAEPPDGAFEALGNQILNQRLESLAAGFLEELRADAVIQ